MNELNVLYATDSNYARHCAASVYSLLENNKSFSKINVYIIDDKISEDCKNKFAAMIKEFPNANLVYYPFEKLYSKLKLNDKSGYALVGYARLMLSEITEAEKILYIDCDTIINSSLESLWNTDVSECIIAGVQDNPALFMAESIGMNSEDRYINGGVLLINLKKWRDGKIEDKIIKMISDYNGFVPHHDQGIINGVCRETIKIIHPKFNTMSQLFSLNVKQIKSLYDMKYYYGQNELDEATASPVIIHYISKFYNRPWFKSCTHPMKDLYVNYLEKTPFDVVLQDGELERSVRMRKFIFEHFPFCIYALSERILDLRRKIKIKKQ